MNNITMKVIKRNGDSEQLNFSKINYRLAKLIEKKPVLSGVILDELCIQIITNLYDGITTKEIDEISARLSASKIDHPDYNTLASRISVSNLQKNTPKKFSQAVELLGPSIIHTKVLCAVKAFTKLIDDSVVDDNDYLYDFFGLKTLEKSYLLKKDGVIIETPQFMLMRTALGLHCTGENVEVVKETVEKALESYSIFSKLLYTHASPTLFNSGCIRQQNSSCFLLNTTDSLDKIMKTLGDCAQISKYAGGIGVNIGDIRGKNSVIKGTGGKTDGIIKLLRIFNDLGRYANQCFTPDTWVYSKEGPKQMGDITAGDYLVTIDGSFKKVNEVIENKVSKEILEVRATNSLFPVKVTKEHELYLIKGQKKNINYSLIKNRLEKGIAKPGFYSAGELTEDDIVGFPIPTYEMDNDIDDLDYYKFYGIMLGDGHGINGRNEYGVSLGNDTKEDLKDFMKGYLHKKGVHYWESRQESKCSNIGWSGNDKLKLSRDMMYGSDNQKRIQEEFLHLPKAKIMKIIEGLLRTDGSNLKELYFYSASQKMIMQMRYLMLRIGILTSGYVKDNVGESHTTIYDRIITTKQVGYCLRIPKHPILSSIIKLKNEGQFFKYFEWNGVLWGRIKNIERIQYSGPVLDFNMVDNHNYLTDMGLVHNSGKRNGSIAVYLPTHHPDILEFLDIRKNTGDENLRARDLFSALWVSDYFMECVENDTDWDLLSPDECPDLSNSFGDHYKSLHNRYVKAGLSRQTLKAREIWSKIIVSQIETGMPYMLYADAVNRRNNQSNLGTIKNSNLCVSGDTKILTSKGHLKISSLENESVEVWNGEKFTETVVRKTGTSQHLMKVMTSDGSELFCTPYHKFYNTAGECIRTADLVEGTYLETCSFPVIKSDRNLEMIQQLFDRELCRKEDKFEVSNPCKEYLAEIKLVLQTFGCNVLLKQDRNSWKLVLSHRDVYDLYFLGINFKGFIPIGEKKRLLGLRVVSTEFTERLHETTYCFTESERGKGVFNGILTGNCAEVMLRANEEEIATCNIATVSLPKHVSVYENGVKYFDFDKLLDTVGTIVENLNRVIDVNFYPVSETERSNKAHRPIIIGAQGLQNLFFELGIPFECDEARHLNKKIYEAIHYASIKKSCDLSKIHGPYSSFEGSPLSEGIFQYNSSGYTGELSFDWDSLRSEVVKHGLRNSMLTGSPPTASTSQILGNYESFEPLTNNFMTRDTLSGNFPVINRYLINDLIKINCWNTEIKEKIMRENGSIQGIPEIPENLKNLYKTVWEVSQKTLIDYSADRQLFTDHSQSLNIFMTNPSIAKISSMHFYGWKSGLKTGMYYLRTRAMVTPEKFTVSSSNPQEISCPLKKPNSPEECAACSG
jgi:ribonucleotide reductase alpha subunit